MSAEGLNAKLVEQLRAQNSLHSDAVAQAFLATPRHLFLPHSDLAEAYADRAVATKLQDEVAISSCSQPAIIAIMLEQLDLREGMNVLEVGAGTGYNAALMSRLVGTHGHITTLDIDEDIVAQARENLRAAGIDETQVSVIRADGGEGYPPHAPYERIILTVSAWDISPAWFEQLADGGVLVLPLSLGAKQYSIAFEKVGNHLRSRSLQLCGFMTLRGAFAGPRRWLRLDGLQVGGDELEHMDRARLHHLLMQQPRARDLNTEGWSLTDLLDDLAAQHERVLTVVAESSQQEFAYAYALVTPALDSAVVFPLKDWVACEPLSQVFVFGSDAAYDFLQQHIARFVSAGSLSLVHGVIEAYPIGRAPADTPVLRKRWMEYVLTPAHMA